MATQVEVQEAQSHACAVTDIYLRPVHTSEKFKTQLQLCFYGSRKRSFSKTLFKPDEFENVGFVF